MSPLTGVPSAGTRHTVWLNGIEYPIRGPVKRNTRSISPEQPHVQGYRLSPWSGGVGARSADPSGWPRPNMVYDATADTSKPGGITPPLLKQTATQAGTPTQTGRIFAFGEIGGVLNAFSLGSVAGPSTRLLRWEWDGATETWTKTDITSAGVGFAGKNVAEINSNLVVAFQRETGNDPSYAYSTDGTNWTIVNDGVVATTANNPWVSNFGTSATGYALIDGTALTLALYSFTLGAAFTLVLDSVVPSTETTKAFFSWKNDAGADVLYILTDKAMRQSNATPNAFSLWKNFYGGNAAFPFGNNLYIAHNTKGGVTQYTWDANSGLVQMEGGLDLGDGLPSDTVGPVTGLHYRNGYLYAVVSGDLAATKTAIYKRRIPFTPEEGWHAVYKAGTANQSAAAIWVSEADDTTVRVHVAQEASSTTDNLYFVMEGGTPEYENGGYVTWPEIVFGDTRGASAVTEATIEADGLTATETVTLAFDKDGAGSFTDFGAFTSTVKTLPASPDAAVTMNRGIPRITFARDTTTTLKATMRSLVFKVLVKTGLLLEHTFEIDLLKACDTTVTPTIEGNRANIFALTKTGGLQTFQLDTDIDSTSRRVFTLYAEADVDSYARGAGGIVRRSDRNHFMRVKVAEAIGN